MLDFFTKIDNSVLHNSLRKKILRASLNCFWTQMDCVVDTLPNKMNPQPHLFNIYFFEANNKIDKGCMGTLEFISGDLALGNDADSSDEVTEVGVVGLRKDVIEKSWKHSIHVAQKLLCLIPTIDFFGRIAWRTVDE